MGKRKRKKSGNRWVVYVVVAVVGVVVAGVVTAGVAVWLLTGHGPGVFSPAGPLGTEMKYLPDGFVAIHSRRMDPMLASPAYQQLRNASADVKVLETGPDVRWTPVSDVERVTTANGLFDNVIVLTLKRPITGAEVEAANSLVRWTQEDVNGYTLYTSAGLGVTVSGGGAVDQGDAFCVPESKVVVFGTGASLRPILKRNAPPKLTANMARGLQLVHFDKALVNVRDCGEKDAWLDKDTPLSLEVKLPDVTRDLEVKATETDLGQDVATTLTYVCKSPAAAANLKQRISDATQKLAGNRAEGRAVYEDEKVNVNGSVLTIGQSLKADAILQWWRNRPFVGFGQ